MKKILVDTNVLVYLGDAMSPWNNVATSYFHLVERDSQIIYTSHQNILELIRTLIRDYGFEYQNAEKKVRLLLEERGLEIIHPKNSTLDTYFNLTKKYGCKSGIVYDLYLLATAIDNGIECLVTNNASDFDMIKEIEVIDIKTLVLK